jgi:two-component system, NtrC family, nitrogen regulation response regulator NtrX
MGLLIQYPWPGNVRELKNLVERLVIMTTSYKIEMRHLPSIVLLKGTGTPIEDSSESRSLSEARLAFDRDYILKKLEENNGNVSRTAEALGIERSHLYRKMKNLKINFDKPETRRGTEAQKN